MRKVFEVALEQLAAHGFSALSLPDVAAAAGLNKTSLYRRWPTKADLVREALNASMGHDAPPPATGDLRRDMVEMAWRALEFGRSPLGRSVLRTLLADGAEPEVRAVAEVMIQGRDTSGPREILQRAIERGDLPPETDVRLLLSVVAGTVMHWLFVEQVDVTRAQLERLVDLVLHGAVCPGGNRAGS